MHLEKYAFANGLEHKPTFAWCVHHPSHNQEGKMFNKSYEDMTLTEDTQIWDNIPRRSVQEALKIDQESGIIFWEDVIE